MLNPFAKNIKAIYVFVSTWAIVVVVHVFVLWNFYSIDLYAAIADSLVYNFLFAFLARGFWYPIRYLQIENRNVINFIFNHLSVVILFMIIWLGTALYIMKVFISGNHVYETFVFNSLPGRILIGLLYYLIFVLIYYLYIYYSSFQKNLLRQSDLKMKVKETQLSLLKSQLNPHFIFNSLNSINSLTISNPDKARDMIVKLSSFLRYALDQNANQIISFSKEMENSLLYLDIEKTRFGDKLIVKKEIPEDCLDLKIPNMILQPLIENAIKYGVHEMLEPVELYIKAIYEKEELKISITNTYDPAATVKKGKGIGLTNVRERLYLIYGEIRLLKTSAGKKTFEVNLHIPQNKC